MSRNVDFDSHRKRRQDVACAEFYDFVNKSYVLNNSEFVDRLLQKSEITNGRDLLISALNAGTKTRAQVVRNVLYILDAEGREIHANDPLHSAGPRGREKDSPGSRELLSIEFEREPSMPSSLALPINAEFILHIFLKTDELDAVVGDLLEKYKKKWERFGPRRAKFWFYSEVLRSLWPLLKRLVAKAGGLLALGEWIRRHVS